MARLKVPGFVFLLSSLVLLAAWLALRSKSKVTSQPEVFKLELSPLAILSYRLRYSSQGTAEIALPKGPAQGQSQPQHHAIDLLADGTLQMKVLEQKADQFNLAFSFKPARWHFSSPLLGDTPRPEQIDGLLELGSDASIRSFTMNSDTYKLYGLLLADIFRLIDLHLPAGPEQSWSGSERNFDQDLPTSFEFIKQNLKMATVKKRYLKPRTADLRVEGEGNIELNRQHYLDAVQIVRQRSTLRLPMARTEDRTELSLELLPLQKNFVTWSPQGAALVHETLEGEAYQHLAAEMMHRGRLGNLSWQDLQRLVAQLQREHPEANVETFMLLRSFIFLHPEQLELLLSYLTSLSYDDPRCATVAAALTDIGNLAAQKLLMTALDQIQGDLDSRERLIPHLGLIKNLGPAAEHYLYQLAETEAKGRIKQTAELAIGVMGGNFVSTEDRPRRLAALEFARQRLEAASSPVELDHALRIFGNIGASEQLISVKPYLMHQDPNVKIAAIEALRDIDDPQAAELLFGILKDDQSDVFRTAAAKSLNKAIYQTNGYETLRLQLFKEKNTLIIQTLISHLATLAASHPEVKELLQQYRAQCGKTDVCSYVAGALASI